MTQGEMMDNNEMLAREVMGWLPHCRNNAIYVPAHLANEIMEKAWIAVNEWQPYKDISQTFMLVEKLRDRGFSYVLNALKDGKHLCTFSDSIGREYCGESNAPAEAIYAAILQTLQPQEPDR